MPNLLFAPKLLTKQITFDHGWSGIAVTPADGTDLPDGPCQALYVTGAGNLNVTLSASPVGTNTAVLTVAAGTIVRVACNRVLSTSTTATGIFALHNRRV